MTTTDDVNGEAIHLTDEEFLLRFGDMMTSAEWAGPIQRIEWRQTSHPRNVPPWRQLRRGVLRRLAAVGRLAARDTVPAVPRLHHA